jgi:O-methyltransferase
MEKLPEADDEELRGLYLDLLKRCLTGILADYEFVRPRPTRWWRSMWYRTASAAIGTTGLDLVRRVPTSLNARHEGLDWPAQAFTMVGMRRLDNVQECVSTVLREHVPGDLIECGVWRGGTTIFMRALLKVYGEFERTVWVADSFQGFPKPSPGKFPADEGDSSWSVQLLAVSRAQVEENFRKFGLLDGQVRFLEGWFRDTLPEAPTRQVAVLRLDGDLYESTMDALTSLYPKVSAGGYVIVDDYGAHKGCRAAIDEYRERHDSQEPIQVIDDSGAIFWKRDPHPHSDRQLASLTDGYETRYRARNPGGSSQ